MVCFAVCSEPGYAGAVKTIFRDHGATLTFGHYLTRRNPHCGNEVVAEGFVVDNTDVNCWARFAHKTVESADRQSQLELVSATHVRDELFTEKHYSVVELAKLWGLSERTIRRMLENEPGFSAEEARRRGSNDYKTLRLLEIVALRVHRQLRIAGW